MKVIDFPKSKNCEKWKDFIERLKNTISLRDNENMHEDFLQDFAQIAIRTPAGAQRMAARKKIACRKYGYPLKDFPKYLKDKIARKLRGEKVEESPVDGMDIRPRKATGKSRKSGVSKEIMAEFKGKITKDFVECCRWIYDNIANRDVNPADAPSAGAYNHLLKIQGNPDFEQDFFRLCYQKLFTISNKSGESKRSENNVRIGSAIERIRQGGYQELSVLPPCAP